MRHVKPIALLLPLALITARCGDAKEAQPDTGTDAQDTIGPDTEPDTAPDTAPDTRPDTTDAVDVPTDEGPWPCTPEYASRPVTIFGGLGVGSGGDGDPDRPELITLYGGVVWLLGRITTSPGATDVPRFTLVMVNARTAMANSDYYHPLASGSTHGTLDLSADHPVAAFVDPSDSSVASPALAFADLTGILSNRMSYMLLNYPPADGAMAGLDGSDTYASDPAVASSDTHLLVVYRQGNSTDGTAALDYGRVSTTGSITNQGTIWDTGTRDVGQPALAYDGTGYGLAFFSHAGAGFDEVEFVTLAEDGSPVSGTWTTFDTTSSGNVVVGRPSIAWSGSQHAVLWEEVGVAPTLNLVFIDAAGTTDLVTLEGDLHPHVGTITNDQPGMLDMVWTGYGYGVVWVHEDISTDSHVWFFELDPAGELTGTPELLNPDAEESFNPSITWKEEMSQRYFVFAWDEWVSTASRHVIHTYSYGCE